MVREVSVLDYLRGSDGHYYKGRSRQILPAIPSRNKYPSNADTSTDSGSYKGNGALPEETLQANDQQKVQHYYYFFNISLRSLHGKRNVFQEDLLNCLFFST